MIDDLRRRLKALWDADYLPDGTFHTMMTRLNVAEEQIERVTKLVRQNESAQQNHASMVRPQGYLDQWNKQYDVSPVPAPPQEKLSDLMAGNARKGSLPPTPIPWPLRTSRKRMGEK